MLGHVEYLDENEPVLANKVNCEQNLQNKPENFVNVSNVDFLADIDQVVLGLMAKLFIGESVPLKITYVGSDKRLKRPGTKALVHCCYPCCLDQPKNLQSLVNVLEK